MQSQEGWGPLPRAGAALYMHQLCAGDKRHGEGSEGLELHVIIPLTHAALGPALQQAIGEEDVCLCSEI